MSESKGENNAAVYWLPAGAKRIRFDEREDDLVTRTGELVKGDFDFGIRQCEVRGKRKTPRNSNSSSPPFPAAGHTRCVVFERGFSAETDTR